MADLIKCVVWDLDGTLWDGTLLEGDDIRLRPRIPAILSGLRNRGILNSVASRNHEGDAFNALRRFNLDRYFTAPQINWNPKPDSLRIIAHELNIGLDSLAFVDDDPFQREAVRFELPVVRVIEAGRYDEILDMPAFKPVLLTKEARQRSEMYKIEAKRKQAEREYPGSRLEFLRSCDMRLSVADAGPADISRLVELAERTNQFNATGSRYNGQDVAALLIDPTYRVLVASLRDRFGDLGTIGAMLIYHGAEVLTVEALMVSCRADGRSIPAALLIIAMHIAKYGRVTQVQAKYRRTERNRVLGVLYPMMGFQYQGEKAQDEIAIWSYDHRLHPIPDVPEWLTLTRPIEDLVR